MVLKSNGTALPADRIAKLLDAWGAARRNRGTAFLNADVELTTVGFTPEQIGLNAAREIIATELARAVGIPAYFIDAPTGSSMTYANAQTARQTLVGLFAFAFDEQHLSAVYQCQILRHQHSAWNLI
jgi:phage portal protein BeeE